ncbi:unnamed protein product, partial [Amoebophrya sp. A120]
HKLARPCGPVVLISARLRSGPVSLVCGCVSGQRPRREGRGRAPRRRGASRAQSVSDLIRIHASAPINVVPAFCAPLNIGEVLRAYLRWSIPMLNEHAFRIH